MSSAAVQSIQQPAQQYSHSSPQAHESYESYPADQSPDLTISPASSRRQHKLAGAGNGAPPNTPQLSNPYSPSVSSVTTNTPRGQRVTSSSQNTPASRTSAASYDPYYSGRSDSENPMPARQSQSASNSSPYSERAARGSQPYNTPELGSGNERDRTRENAGSTPSAAPQSRRKDPRVFSEPQQQSQYASSSQEQQRSGSMPQQSRSANAVGQPPVDTSLPREDSTILNRLVITDPQEDVQRERVRLEEARPAPAGTDVTPVTGLGLVGSEGVDDGGRGGHKSRQEHLKTGQPKRETKFGEYILGQTVGEGEFGKVKMGWKKEGGVQVAIKLIRRESLGNNPNRLPKIYREIAILRGLQHPNIVRLHEMVETERHIGIILEYASGGELFDYILNHRYLKDNAARRLFAQLVSGVGYLHKNGIVHRDLKLENLLLDRNRNIIITDFGFANTFNSGDELGDEIEYNLANRDFVQKMNLEHVQSDGHRRGDLMQTSCGSPCYAAPELVVSDSLYTGRKVDVWSCGVILYAMLAGYLPFDDDPANPEGDNINLLYKYIVSTPLTFPEYVTPHARDLLRRILVPDPRKRADLFEVARHSWLSEYAHVVGFITSSTSTSNEIANATMSSDAPYDAAQLARSHSVREPVKPKSIAVGGFPRTTGMDAAAEQTERPQTQRDNKRRTVQLEYVAPQSQTARGDMEPSVTSPQAQPAPVSSGQGRSRARADSTGGPIEVTPSSQRPVVPSKTESRPTTQQAMAPPARPIREPPRAVSDSTAFVTSPTPSSAARPSTRGSIGGTSRLPSRGNSYGQPVAAMVAPTNAEGRFSQPAKSGNMVSDGRDPSSGRPLSQQLPSDYQVRPSGEQERPSRGHKRTNTMESLTSRLFGRSNSTRRQSTQEATASRPEKSSRAYPPVSMKNAIANDAEGMPRPSTDSHRPSFSFSRKNSDEPRQRSSRRFSFLPQALSRMSLSGPSKEQSDDSTPDNKRASFIPPRSRQESRQAPSGMAFGRGSSPAPSQDTTGSTIPVTYDSNLDRRRQNTSHGPQRGATAPDLNSYSVGPPQQQQYKQKYPQQDFGEYRQAPSQGRSQQSERFYTPAQSQETQDSQSTVQVQSQQRLYPPGFNQDDAQPPQRQPTVLHKNNRKFAEAYESGGNGGSSGGARRVMDWFRKRGKERSG